MMRDKLGAGMSCTFGVIKIPLFIRLQAHCKFMEMLGHLMVRIKCFVKISFFIPFKSTQANNLIKDFSIPYFDAQI